MNGDFSVSDIASASESMINAFAGGLMYLEGELRNHALVTPEELAEKLGKDVEYVQQQHTAGVLYAAPPNEQSIDEICKRCPDITNSIPLLLSFKEQGKLLLYPAWQVRNDVTEPELPIPGPNPRIYPEVALAREAYIIFAKEIAEDEATATDPKLQILFTSSGGLFKTKISDHIVSHDTGAGYPYRPLPLDQLVQAWHYAINPSGNFT